MRFLNNFISSHDLEDELGLHMADVFYESETGAGLRVAGLGVRGRTYGSGYWSETGGVSGVRG